MNLTPSPDFSLLQFSQYKLPVFHRATLGMTPQRPPYHSSVLSLASLAPPSLAASPYPNLFTSAALKYSKPSTSSFTTVSPSGYPMPPTSCQLTRLAHSIGPGNSDNSRPYSASQTPYDGIPSNLDFPDTPSIPARPLVGFWYCDL